MYPVGYSGHISERLSYRRSIWPRIDYSKPYFIPNLENRKASKNQNLQDKESNQAEQRKFASDFTKSLPSSDTHSRHKVQSVVVVPEGSNIRNLFSATSSFPTTKVDSNHSLSPNYTQISPAESIRDYEDISDSEVTDSEQISFDIESIHNDFKPESYPSFQQENNPNPDFPQTINLLDFIEIDSC